MFNAVSIKIRKAGRLILVLLLILLSTAWEVEGLTPTTDKKIGWDEIRAAFEAFYENPATQEAERILELLSEAKIVGATGDKSKAFDFIFDKSNYDIFRNEIYYGNKTCLEIAFCLCEFSDGYFAEQICETVGVLIRINPELFLSGLYKYRGFFEKYDIRYPVANLPRAYVDRFKAQKHELEKRIEALQKVQVSDYIEIRDKCIKQLQKIIDNIEISLRELER